jgi:hypothetical protein
MSNGGTNRCILTLLEANWRKVYKTNAPRRMFTRAEMREATAEDVQPGKAA